MDQQDQYKLVLHELVDSEYSTSSVHSYIEHINQPNPNETEWGAILRMLEEPSAMSAAEMIDDHLRPSSASVHNSADDDQIGIPPYIGMCPMMSSFDYMHPQQKTQFDNNGDNQLEAQLEMGRPNSSAVHVDCPRLSRSNTRPSTPGNTTDHLDSVWDELLISYNDQSSGAQQTEDYRHQQYYQNQQSFTGSNTILTPDLSSAAHHDVSADYHEMCHHTPCNTVLQRSNSATYDYYSHMNRSESGPCSPATSASSDEPVDMEESLISQTKLNTSNSTDQSSSLTLITELDNNQQQARPSDELLDKKRASKGNSRAKKPKRESSDPKLAIRMKSDTDIVDDGFKWRKYGQKAVKNSPYSRSYYKCIDKRCNVKKHVERQSSEPDVVVTTYKGVHMHPASSSRNNNESNSNGPNDLPHLYPPSQLDHPHTLHRPISQYAYLHSLIAHHITSIYYNNYNYLRPRLSNLPFPLVHTNTPSHDTLDYQLRHHLLELLMHNQDIMDRRSHSI